MIKKKSGFTSMAAIAALIICALVAVIIISQGSSIAFTTSAEITSLGPTKCNKALDLKEYHTDVTMFAARKTTEGSDNPFYEPDLAIKKFIGYLDCKNKERMFDLKPADNKKMDQSIIACGKKAFDNHIEDLQKKMQTDAEFKELYEEDLAEYRKAREEVFENVDIPAGDCTFNENKI